MKRTRAVDARTPLERVLSPAHLSPNAGRHRKAIKEEKRVAEDLGGRALPNSGSLPFGKYDASTAAADVQTTRLLVQHKGTQKDSYGVRRDDLNDLSIQAKRRTLIPVLMVRFERETRCEDEWAMIPASVLKRLLAADERA